MLPATRGLRLAAGERAYTVGFTVRRVAAVPTQATLHRARVLTAIAACLLVLVAGCSSGGQPQSSRPIRGGNLVFDFATAPLDLDPSTSGDNATSMQMWNAWFEYLVQPNSRGPGYSPMLAASYTISADQLVYTFRIRPGVRFSDGRPLTAADVVYSLKRNIRPSISLLNFLNGYISAITAPSPNIVQITLKRPWPNLLADLASPTAAYAVPASTFLVGPARDTFQNTGLNLYPRNLALAKQLMRQSGVAAPVTVPFEVSTGMAQDAILTVAQANLAAIGIRLTPVRKDSASVDNDIIGEKYTMATTFWGDISADPSVQPLFAIDPAYCCNAYFTGLRDPSLVSLARRAVTASPRSQAQNLYDQVQTQFAQQVSVIPLYYPKLIHVLSRRVVGFNVNAYGFYNWAKMALSG
jgi:ABC-type transport system substrate-binding protein